MKKKITILAIDKNILTNFFSLSTLQVLGYLLPIVLLPYLIRTIGPEKFGLIAFAQAFIQYFIMLSDYSFGLTATREISVHRNKEEKVNAIFSTVIVVKLLLVVLSLAIVFIIVYFIPKFRNDWLLYVLSFGAVLGNALFPNWFFQGTEKMKYIILTNLTGGIIFALSIFIFVRKPQDYLFIPALSSLYFLGTGVAGLYIAFKNFNLKFILPSFSTVVNEIRNGGNVFFSLIAVNAYTTSRVFAVGLLTNNIVTGYYSIAERIATFVQSFPLISISQTIYPRLNKIYSRSKRRAVSLMYLIQDATTSAYFLFIPLIILLSHFIVRIICGPGYYEVTLALRFLVFSVFFISANAFKVQFLLICGKQSAYSKIHIFAAVIGLPLIFILVHFFSYLGAALATIAIEALIYIVTSQVLLYTISKKFKGIYPKQ